MVIDSIWFCRGFDEALRAIVANNIQGSGIKWHPNTNGAKLSIQVLY
jgi:hypothetical protein